MLRFAPRFALAAVFCIASACGGAPVAPPEAPAPAPATVAAPEPADPWAIDGELTAEALPPAPPAFPLNELAFAAPPKGFPAPPKSCGLYAPTAIAPASCGDRAAALVSLDEALRWTEPRKRDQALQALEPCSQLPLGMVRALRAELAPAECADSIVASALSAPSAEMPGEIYDTLFGLGLAGILARASTTPPTLAPPHSRERIEAFVASDMKAWGERHAKVIQDLAALGSRLRYYGRAVVAVEAGMADMRFVEAMRTLPVPDEFAKDEELRETYLASLEQALDARKRRGRDAALVGLGSLATIGVIRDERVERARALLSRMYGGSPIDALDGLRLPPLSPHEPGTSEQRLAARLPVFYSSVLFPSDAATDPDMLRSFAEKGISLPHRIGLAKASLPAPLRLLYARARFEMGQNYWRRVDFDETVRLLQDGGRDSDEGKLLLALALALRGGPENAADMMVKAPLRDLGIGRVAALESLIDAGGWLGGSAAFDAALIRQLAAPASADAAYWLAVAAGFRKAAEVLVDVQDKRDAETRAGEAEQTAQAIQTPTAQP